MKRLPVFMVGIMVALVAVVAGCGGAHRYDSRLVAADSLMAGHPDSALTLIEAIVPDSLTDEGDRAYRDLLLTQARYKCYITATSDSDINRALAYYRNHSGDREKLTRAYLYKGAVMEELGHPDSAMYYYKVAEANAAPDDYFNLGYANMRMGSLYRDKYEMDGKHISKYEKALECFSHIRDTHYQLVCMLNLGSLYCLKYPQRADSIFSQAIPLALQLQDTASYFLIIENQIKNNFPQRKYQESYGLVQKVLTMNTSRASNTFYIYAAYVYACLQMTDSAEILLNEVADKPFSDEVEKLTYLETLRDISLCRGDSNRFLRIETECKRLADSLQSLNSPLEIMHIELSMDSQAEGAIKESQKQSESKIRTLTVILIAVTLLFSLELFRRKKLHDKRIHQFMESTGSQVEELKQLKDNLKHHEINDETLKGLIDSYMNLMNEVIDECYHSPNKTYTKRIKDIIKFRKENKEQWTKLYGYLDLKHNNIISHTKANYPDLRDKDLLLIAMTALDFSYIQIAMILGYTNATTIGGNKLRLAKKMRLEGSLNDYISQFKSD